jgi:hypothetical protein
MHENREISSAPSERCEGRSVKVQSRTTDMHVLEKSDWRRSTDELAEQGKATSCGGWGGKGAAGGELRWNTHAPDSEQESACPSVRRCASGKLQFLVCLTSRSFRRAVCVDALVRLCAGAVRENRPYRDSRCVAETMLAGRFPTQTQASVIK